MLGNKCKLRTICTKFDHILVTVSFAASLAYKHGSAVVHAFSKRTGVVPKKPAHFNAWFVEGYMFVVGWNFTLRLTLPHPRTTLLSWARSKTKRQEQKPVTQWVLRDNFRERLLRRPLFLPKWIHEPCGCSIAVPLLLLSIDRIRGLTDQSLTDLFFCESSRSNR